MASEVRMIRACGSLTTPTSRKANRSSNVRVAVRVRSLIPMEKAQGARSVVHVLDGKLVVQMDPGTTPCDDFLRLNKSKERKYAFDIAFDENADQREVYKKSTMGVVDGVLGGINATVFVYGATAAGKTYTMLGTPSEPGIMSQTLEELFEKIERLKEDKTFKVKCSFIEIYNEYIRDLLGGGQDLDLREDPMKGMSVAGVSEIGGLDSVDAIMELLQRGNKNRTTEPTAANVTSSRSHAILQVIVEQSERGQGAATNIQIGKLSLIDLAGSERASVTNNRGIRLLEGANINRSLLALGNCITALSDGGKGVFVPYRDSKLTRLLKDSLGGNCMTVMIANVSPSHMNYEDTRNTLKYANRAKNIQTDIQVNRVTVTQHISHYNEIISELKSVVYDLKGKLSVAEKTSESVKEASERWKQDLMENIDERVRLKKSLIDIKNEVSNLTSERIKLIGKCTTPRNVRTPSNGHVVEPTPGAMIDEPSPMDDDDHVVGPDDNGDDSDGGESMAQKISERISELRSRKRQLEERIRDNDATMRVLQHELPSRVKDEDVCAFLSLLYRNQILEIEAMDREDQFENLQRIHEESVSLRTREIQSLKEQVLVRNEMLIRLHESLAERIDDILKDSIHALIDAPNEDEENIITTLPCSPIQNIRLNVQADSPTIPEVFKIRGIGESILTSVKNSPRFSVRKEHPEREDRVAVPPLPMQLQQVDTTPVRKPNNHKQNGSHSVRARPQPNLTIEGSTCTTQAPASTRRVRMTERSISSKQQSRRRIEGAVTKFSKHAK
jgi:hypothetical protein